MLHSGMNSCNEMQHGLNDLHEQPDRCAMRRMYFTMCVYHGQLTCPSLYTLVEVNVTIEDHFSFT